MGTSFLIFFTLPRAPSKLSLYFSFAQISTWLFSYSSLFLIKPPKTQEVRSFCIRCSDSVKCACRNNKTNIKINAKKKSRICLRNAKFETFKVTYLVVACRDTPFNSKHFLKGIFIVMSNLKFMPLIPKV